MRRVRKTETACKSMATVAAGPEEVIHTAPAGLSIRQVIWKATVVPTFVLGCTFHERTDPLVPCGEASTIEVTVSEPSRRIPREWVAGLHFCEKKRLSNGNAEVWIDQLGSLTLNHEG